MEKTRMQLQYYGRVQGVGFRYWACMQAEKSHVTGWAKNEDDGSVTIQVQGSLDQIAHFRQGMEHHFTMLYKVEDRIIPLEEKERDFRVRYR